MTTPPRRNLFRHLPLVICLALALFLRVRGIADDSLWSDEVLSVRIAKMNLMEVIKFDIAWEQIPPVHHLLLHFWMPVFGDSEFSLRMPSTLAGVAGVGMTYVLVGGLLDRRTALVAALLMAVSPVMIEYAQEARAYTLMVLLVLISTDLFVRLQRQPTQMLHAAYVIVSVLLIYTHLYGIFALVAHHAFYAWRLWRIWKSGSPLSTAQPGIRSWIIDNIAIAALYSPWIPIVLQWMRMVSISFWVKKASWDDISRAYWMYAGSTPLLIAMVVLAVLGVRELLRRRSEWITLLLALAILPVIIPATASVLGRPSFAPRYGMIACIGLYPLMAAGVSSVRWMWFRAGVIIAIITLAITSLNHEAVNVPKESWRQAMAYLDAQMRPGDVAAVHIKATTRQYDYYLRREDVPRRGFDGAALPFSLPRPPGQRVWFVLRGGWAMLNQILQRGPWHVVSHRWFDDILIMQLEEIPTDAPATSPAHEPPPSSTSPASPMPSSAIPQRSSSH